MASPPPHSHLEISRANLLHNISFLTEYANTHSSKKYCIAVVKANAYGHNLAAVVSIADDEIDYWQVDDVVEAAQLRSLTRKPIIILGYVHSQDISMALDLDAELCVWSVEHLNIINDRAAEHNRVAKVHLSIDTQLGREGVLLQDLPDWIEALTKQSHVELSGVYSHFSNIEDTTDSSHATLQLSEFSTGLEQLRRNSISPKLISISATSGVLVYEPSSEAHTAIRIGIGMYGLWPATSLQQRFGDAPTLRPVLRWITHIAQIKHLPADFPIGYGLTYVTSKPTTIAVIPQGYSDGYDRGLSNIGEVLIHGQRCTVLGRVAMNMCVVDISHLTNPRVEDEVILLGKQGDAEISAEEIAAKLGTINYEIVARLSPALPAMIV